MNMDSICITDPPDYTTRYEADDLPEAIDDLTFSPADDEKINQAANWGRSLILAARAGSQQALADLQHRMHITRLEVIHD